MMAWYVAWYGRWNESCGVHKIACSYNRKDIFEKAQQFANETGKTVTIKKEAGTHLDFYTIKPMEG